MAGDELAAAVRSAAPDMPIIMLTGFGEMMTDAGERPADVDFVLGKPVTLSDLRRALATVLSR